MELASPIFRSEDPLFSVVSACSVSGFSSCLSFFFFVALIWQDGKEERLAFLEQCRLSYNVSYCVFQMHPVLRPERAPFYRALCLTGSGAVWAL